MPAHRILTATDRQPEAFSRMLSGLLHELGLSHVDVAKSLGLNVNTVHSWTRRSGSSLPAGDNLDQLCYLLDQHRPGSGRRLHAVAIGGAAEGIPSAQVRALATTFIGRETQVEDVLALLQQRRMVTLAGTGGVGKTRLALQIASLAALHFEDGVWVVELASITSGNLVLQAVAAAVGVHEGAAGGLATSLDLRLANVRALLVVDNCEHLAGPVNQCVARLLNACPNLRVLATSREPLRVAGEHVWRVPALGLPPASEAPTRTSLLRSEAARLFIERALSARGGFVLAAADVPVVAQLVRRLEGIPLAIELAAARVEAMSLPEMLSRLDDRFRLLTGGSATLPQHRTLRAAVDWSHESLPTPLRALFAQLAVFRGSWTTEAADAVCDRAQLLTRESMQDLLAELTDRSLLITEEQGGQIRHRMLETIRDYAREKLVASGQARNLLDRHAAHIRDLLVAAEDGLKGAQYIAWLARLDADRDNVRAALSWCLAEQGDPAAGLAIVGRLGIYWSIRGDLSEARSWAELALARVPPDPAAPREDHGRALICLGEMAFSQADYAHSAEYWTRARDLFERLGQTHGLGYALVALSQQAMYHDRFAEAVMLAARARDLLSEAGDAWGLGGAWLTLGQAYGRMRSGDDAGRLMREAFMHSLSAYRALGNARGMGMALNGLGGVALRESDYPQANVHYEQAQAIFRAINDRNWVSRVLTNLGECARGMGDFARARTLCEEAIAIRREMGAQFGMATLQINLGLACLELGEVERAEALFLDSMRMNHAYGDEHGMAEALQGLAGAWIARRIRVEEAVTWLAQVERTLGAQDGPDRTAHEKHAASGRAYLGEPRYAAARERGRSLPLADSIARALGQSHT